MTINEVQPIHQDVMSVALRARCPVCEAGPGAPCWDLETGHQVRNGVHRRRVIARLKGKKP